MSWRQSLAVTEHCRTQNSNWSVGEGGIKPMTWELQQVALLATVGGRQTLVDYGELGWNYRGHFNQILFIPNPFEEEQLYSPSSSTGTRCRHPSGRTSA